MSMARNWREVRADAVAQGRLNPERAEHPFEERKLIFVGCALVEDELFQPGNPKLQKPAIIERDPRHPVERKRDAAC